MPLPVKISYIPTGSPRTVTIAGAFNGWKPSATPLTREPRSLAWSTTLHLPPGVYPYRIVVNGSRWITPPEALHSNDGNGNINALLLVAPPDFDPNDARTDDGKITASGVFHRSHAEVPPSTVRNARYVTRSDHGHFSLVLRTRRNDVHQVWVIAPTPANATRAAGQKSAESTENRTPMSRLAADALFDYWRANIGVQPGSRAFRYAFLLRDGTAQRIYDNSDRLIPVGATPRWFQLTPMDYPPFETPDWARDAIFYQIFPDRFANGDPKNDPPDTASWGSPPTSSNRMGGDLAGVIEHLEYLRDLGVNGLYLNPIFESRSNHGYDTTDYKKIDPRFGTLATLKALTARAHLHGWHVVLDGVFNHSGVDFAPFQSVLREQRNSQYRNWYYTHGFPVVVKEGQKSYEGWYGSPWMPKLNVSNPATRDYLLDVATYWMKEAHIDGWRLDAANEVGHDFWKTFRKTVKAVKPDAFLVGEIWQDAGDWLQGNEMDSVMNYRWRGAAMDFFAFEKSSPSQFDTALERIRSDYPAPATAVMLNMLGSHDVERLRTLCKGDWAKERQAVAFQLTYPGIPCIYYGDEIGLEGGKDPDNRRAMPWDTAKWDKTALAFYKSMIAMRRQHAVLRRGDYQTVLVDDTSGLYGFIRAFNNERALVVFNRSDMPRTAALPIAKIGALPFHTWLDSGTKTERQGDNLTISLPPRGFAVLGL